MRAGDGGQGDRAVAIRKPLPFRGGVGVGGCGRRRSVASPHPRPLPCRGGGRHVLTFGLFFAGVFGRSLFGGRRFFRRRFFGDRAALGDFLGDRGRVFGGRFGRNIVGHRFGDGFGGRFALHRTGRIRFSGFGNGSLFDDGRFGGHFFGRRFFGDHVGSGFFDQSFDFGFGRRCGGSGGCQNGRAHV